MSPATKSFHLSKSKSEETLQEVAIRSSRTIRRQGACLTAQETPSWQATVPRSNARHSAFSQECISLTASRLLYEEESTLSE